MDTSIVRHKSDSRVHDQSIEVNTTESVHDETSAQTSQQPDLTAEDVQTQERAADMRSWWNTAMKKYMNRSDGYANVAVLLVMWGHSEDATLQVVELQDLLRNQFHYTTRIAKLDWHGDPGSSMQRELMDFIYHHDNPLQLIMVYFADHGVSNHIKWLNETRYLTRILRRAKTADVLIISATKYTSHLVKKISLLKSRKFELDIAPRKFELITASSIDRIITRPLDHSFTRVFIDSLKQLLDQQKVPISTFRLVQSINLSKHNSDAPAHLWTLGNDGQFIVLAPLKSAHASIEQRSGFRSSPGGYLTLRFGIRDSSLNEEQIEYMAKTLSGALCDKKLIGLKKVEWLEMKAAPLILHADRVAIVMYTVARWKRFVKIRKLERKSQSRGAVGLELRAAKGKGTALQKRGPDVEEDGLDVKKRQKHPKPALTPPETKNSSNWEGNVESFSQNAFDGQDRQLADTGLVASPEGESRLMFPSMTEILEDEEETMKHDEVSRADSSASEVICRCPVHSRSATGTDEQHAFSELADQLPSSWEEIRDQLPDTYKWDTEYVNTHSRDKPNSGCWTCVPLDGVESQQIPLTIAGAPVVIPVNHQWPPVGDLHPPPDPRSSALLDCSAELPLVTIKDIFLTFEGSLGFYILLNGFLQIVVSDTFDTIWASSHLPHRYGGLKVCYIDNFLEPTMLPSHVATTLQRDPAQTQPPHALSTSRQSRSTPLLHLNDFIEARVSSMSTEKFMGRIGLKVAKDDQPFLIMSSHVITEAILSKSFFGLARDPIKRLREDWDKHAEIRAGNAKIGTIEKTYDREAGYYPTNFNHDVTLIRPLATACLTGIESRIKDIGWLDHSAWSSLRQQPSALKILEPTDVQQAVKCIKCALPSDVNIVGEGIFFNQTNTAGSKPTRGHDLSTWKQFVSRAILYRVNPKFDPSSGHSGMALYAEGSRTDDTHGPGIVGFQSFVQRSSHPQNFNLPEGAHLETRLKGGQVAFYGAFEVPDELRTEYDIL